MDTKIETKNITRVEVIGATREFIRYFGKGKFRLQDNGQTLKIFIIEEKNNVREEMIKGIKSTNKSNQKEIINIIKKNN